MLWENIENLIMKHNYIFAVKYSGVPKKPRLFGEVHKFNLTKDAFYYVRRKSVEARHAKAQLISIVSDKEEDIESVRNMLDRMDHVESKYFLREHEVRV